MNLALTLSRHLNTARQARHPSQILISELKFPFQFPSHKDASPPHPRFQSLCPAFCFSRTSKGMRPLFYILHGRPCSASPLPAHAKTSPFLYRDLPSAGTACQGILLVFLFPWQDAHVDVDGMRQATLSPPHPSACRLTPSPPREG